MIEIETDVPLTASYKNGRPEVYPWRKLEVGDSFFVPEERTAPKHIEKRAYEAAKRTGRKFTCRRQDGGVRIWRVA